ncbi:hypothetical protein [Arsukibacterium perlucidum]|uniref:hypothetical protein n=1 Tax=Arsukibacterium perlucidum TaxID=368811 RepID=UPI0003623E02|nr:hypothetical protein [Arsukibacterium perlucidum]
MFSNEHSSNYAAWLSQTRQQHSEQQHLSFLRFSADNTTVSFDHISYATAKVIPEHSAEQE